MSNKGAKGLFKFTPVVAQASDDLSFIIPVYKNSHVSEIPCLRYRNSDGDNVALQYTDYHEYESDEWCESQFLQELIDNYSATATRMYKLPDDRQYETIVRGTAPRFADYMLNKNNNNLKYFPGNYVNYDNLETSAASELDDILKFLTDNTASTSDANKLISTWKISNRDSDGNLTVTPLKLEAGQQISGFHNCFVNDQEKAVCTAVGTKDNKNILVCLQGGGGKGGNAKAYGIGASGGGSGGACSAVLNANYEWLVLIVATYKSDKPTNVDYVYCGGDICLLQLDDACYQDDERINGDEIAKRIKDVNNGAASNISIICNGGRGGFTTTKDDEEGKAGGSGGDVKCYCGQSSSQTLHVTQTITGCAGGKTVEDTKDGESGGGYDSRAEEVAFRASNVDHGDLIDTITIKYAGGEGGSCKIQNYGGGAGGGASCFGSGGNGGDSQQSARSVPETSYGAGGGGAGGATSNHLKYGATGGCAVFTISYGWHNEN